MKKILILLLISIFLILCVGCRTVKKDIEKLAMVMSTGYDYVSNDQYMITIQVLKTTKQQTSGTLEGGGEQPSIPSDVVIYTSIGNTINEAFDNLTTTLGEEPYFAHNKFIIIGEKLASNGIALVVDSDLRGNEMRPNTPVLVAKGTAYDIIKTLTPNNTIPSIEIENIIKLQSEKSLSTMTNLKQLYNGLANKTSSISTGVIYLEKANDIAHRGEIFRIEGTAIFQEDKLIGFLNKEETKGLSWVKGNVQTGDIVITSPDNKDDIITLKILSSKSKIKPIINDNHYLIEIIINEQSDIVGMTGKYDPMKNYKLLDTLAEVQNETIKKQIELTIEKAQKKYKVDFFDFGEIIHRKYPETWNIIKDDWDKLFPYIIVKIKVDSTLKRPGSISKPAY
ncbi:Ger(x)C family spore germination protein [Clostridium sediminicola]|uniref:Ger(x)C family spore germination protein n=1 Tax=Clostridium sediminicola TaxID=3114879 RepID=UPI0031F1CC02